MKIPSYPRIRNIGHPDISALFEGHVIAQEKIDGSQVSFLWLDDQLYARSKGAEIDIDAPSNLFAPAVETFKRLAFEGRLEYGWIYRGEALWRPKHNTLVYNQAPVGGVILYDIEVGPSDHLNCHRLAIEANKLDLEVVPLLAAGYIEDLETFKALLDTDSCLGGCKIEGVVIKNYAKFGQDGKVLMGKYVSEAFKEQHQKDWKVRNPNRKDILAAIIESYKTDARWNKAVQALRDNGDLEQSPRDIGPLIKQIQEDVFEECEAEIKQVLFNHFKRNIARGITAGFPEWYKNDLASKQFEEAA